jgi:N-acetylglucosaminyldiphosphoundecaprenol N-acetyl-beta-D-mannosaminyltransferase
MSTPVGGFLFDAVDEQQAANIMIDGVVTHSGGRVVTPNTDILRLASGDAVMGALLRSATLLLADGMPVVWAARLLGRPLPARVAGSALAPLIAGMAAERGIGVFLLGGGAGTAERAAEVLSKRHPGIRVGWHFPPFGFETDSVQLARIDTAVGDFGPCICLIGLGFPKQDRLGEQLLHRHPEDWFIGAGASIGFIAGDFRRAPEWAQRLGLEWFHRLTQEPGRLAGRYARDIPFVLRLLATSAVIGLVARSAT